VGRQKLPAQAVQTGRKRPERGVAEEGQGARGGREEAEVGNSQEGSHWQELYSQKGRSHEP